MAKQDVKKHTKSGKITGADSSTQGPESTIRKSSDKKTVPEEKNDKSKQS